MSIASLEQEQGQTAAAPDRSRENNFNALRMVFALSVIYSHSFPMVGWGTDPLDVLFNRQTYTAEVAVCGFFAISGLLVTESWLRSRGFLDYLKKRVLRIYPGFILAAVICLLVIGPLGADSPGGYFDRIDLVGFAKQALTLGTLAVPPAFKECALGGSINGSLWTIRIEFECYLLVAALGMLGLLRRRTVLWPAVLLAVAAAGLVDPRNAWATHHLPPSLVFGEGIKLRLVACFLAGMVYSLERTRIRLTPAGLWIALSLSALASAAGVLWYVLPLAGSYLLFYTAYNRRIPLQRFGARFDLSYGTYLYGWPLQLLIVYWFGSHIGPWALFLLASLASCAAAFASWTLVERPFLDLKRGTPT